MKHLLLFAGLALAVASPAAAQMAAWVNPLPVDSTTHLITYTGVVQVPGATQAELYSRAREWFATTFGSSKAVLEMDNAAAGKLIGHAYAPFEMAFGLGHTAQYAMWRQLKIEVKDGRYRYTLSDFEQGGPVETPNANRQPLETWLGRFKGTEKGVSGKMLHSVVAGADETAKAEVASIRQALTVKSDGF